MTDIKSKRRQSCIGVLFASMSAVTLLLAFVFSDDVMRAMSEGLRLCASSVIPSLFPFMVLSDLFISSGAANAVSYILGRPLSHLFGISSCGVSAVLLGLVLGFPIGIKSALTMYKDGKITQRELEHISMFCSIPSSVFLISAVGASLFCSKNFGVLLYISHVLSAVIIGVVGRFFFSSAQHVKRTDNISFSTKSTIASAITASVRDSSLNMLVICAFVLFFSAFLGALRGILAKAVIASETFLAFIFGFFEITGGIAASSRLETLPALLLTAAVSAWGGLSVHFQFLCICEGTEFSKKPYFISKLLSAMLCPAVLAILLIFFGKNIQISVTESINSALIFSPTPFSLTVLLVFVLTVLSITRSYRKRRK